MSKQGAELIQDERRRQIIDEKWTPAHDDQHENGELALAAIAYASPLPVKVEVWFPTACGCRSAGECTHYLSGATRWIDPWPWEEQFDKRGRRDRIRDLVKAGALIAAEIDRLQREWHVVTEDRECEGETDAK